MRILIVANFTRDFSKTDNGRFLYLAKKLAENHDVEIVTTEFSHGAKKKKKPIIIQYPFKITLLREPGYKKNISLLRFCSHYVWGKNVRDYLKTIEKPDVVYCAVPSLTGPGYVADYCQKNGVRFVIDIQDLWPESFQMVIKVPVVSDMMFSPFKKMADHIYRSADHVCAVSKTYVNRALSVNNKCKSGTTVFLGTNLDTFDAFASENPIMQKQEGEVWLAYCGSLGNSYDLPCVFDALDILSKKGIKPKFVIMGDGPKHKEFKSHASSKNIDVIFTGSLPYNQMCALLCACDITVNPITHNAAASIINKHGDYAASGLPVVSTQENEEYRSLIEEYKMGFNCKNGDPDDLAEKMMVLIQDKERRITMGANARRCGKEQFDRKYSYVRLINVIEGKES
ncbi:glycosyltransferase family 4 protein [Hungatella effluvii]|uniref:glycosyltransferase family 4 protein n=1 Tax=Hungatella effluvii TaxID=1096246 RepID=UPI0022E377BC|nr:glycosyltransferase family 4 protein [Hungatella effluvii]